MRRPWTLAAGVGTFAAFAAFAWLLDRPGNAPPAPVDVRPEKAAAQMNATPVERTATHAGELFGVNEGLALPQHALTTGLSPSDRFLLAGRAGLLRELGARHVRVNSHGYPALNHHAMTASGQVDWRAADAFFDGVDPDLDLLVVIGPWPGTRTASVTSRYLPDDMDAYTDWVHQVVARYGDRVDAWEIDNEPDLHHSEAPRGGDQVDAFEPPQEYAQVLRATSAAIRAEDPTATVLSGGMYRAMTPKGRAYLEELVAIDGVLDAVDAISLHCYFADSDLTPIYELFATSHALAPDKPVWITETSVPSSADRADEASPEWQARMVVALHGAMIAQGADRIYWHTLFDAPEARVDGPTGFRTNSLYALSGAMGQVEPKPAALVYARLTARLADQPLEGLELQPGVIGFRDGWLVYEGDVETPPDATGVEDLLTGERGPLRDITQAPAWLSR